MIPFPALLLSACTSTGPSEEDGGIRPGFVEAPPLEMIDSPHWAAPVLIPLGGAPDKSRYAIKFCLNPSDTRSFNPDIFHAAVYVNGEWQGYVAILAEIVGDNAELRGCGVASITASQNTPSTIEIVSPSEAPIGYFTVSTAVLSKNDPNAVKATWVAYGYGVLFDPTTHTISPYHKNTSP